MKRQNRMGMWFTLTAEHGTKTRIATKDAHIVVDVPLNEISRRWYQYQMVGTSIQLAFNNLPADQREFIITGITPDVWNKIFEGAE